MTDLRARDVATGGARPRRDNTSVSIFVLKCPDCRRNLGQQVVPPGGVIGEHLALRHCRDCRSDVSFTYTQEGIKTTDIVRRSPRKAEKSRQAT